MSTSMDEIILKAANLLEGYSIENVHRSLLYSSIYAEVRKKGLDPGIIQPLENLLPKPLVYQSRRSLVPVFNRLVGVLNKKIESKDPVVIENANVEKIVERVEETFAGIDHVMVYDCMSLIEFLVVAASIKRGGLESKIPELVLVNPIGVTRYVTHQLRSLGYRTVLREFAHLLANKLGARSYFKSAYIDFKVHEYGSLGVEEYVDRIDIGRVVGEILDKAVSRRVLVTADHGYDIVYDGEDNYLYVTHGFRNPVKKSQIPLVLFSRFSFFLKAYPRR